MQSDATFRKKPCNGIRAGNLDEWEIKLLDYIADDTDNASVRDTFLDPAFSGLQARSKESHALMVVALKSLSMGKREQAKAYLEKVDHLDYFSEAW